MLRTLICLCVLTASMPAQRAAIAPPAAVAGTISGTVVDAETQKPLSGAHVAIAPVSKRDAFTTTTTGEDGRFTFSSLGPGKYTLTAQRRGYVTQSFHQHGGFSTSIAVGPGLNSNGLVFPMIVEGGISGTIIDEAGEAVRKARVVLFQNTSEEGLPETRQRAQVITDDEGHYSFPHLRPGKYFVGVSAQPWYAQRPETRVTITHPDGSLSIYSGSVDGSVLKDPQAVITQDEPSPLDVTFPFTYYAGTTESPAATPIVLGKGEKAVADVSLQAVPALRFRFNVDDADHSPPSFVLLRQKLLDGTSIAIPTNAQQIAPGVMEITGIAPGSYTNRRFSGTEAERQDFEAGANGITEKAAAALPAVTATITPESMLQHGGLSLVLRDKSSREVFSEHVGRKGEVEFKPGVPPGSYEVSVQGAPDLFISSLRATGGTLTGRTLKIKNVAVKLTMQLSEGMAEVSGMALRDDKPAAGALVLLAPADPGNNRVLFRQDQSDSDGTFKLSGVVPGQYTLVAIQDGWDLNWADPGVLQKYLPRGQPLTVEIHGRHSVKVKAQ